MLYSCGKTTGPARAAGGLKEEGSFRIALSLHYYPAIQHTPGLIILNLQISSVLSPEHLACGFMLWVWLLCQFQAWPRPWLVRSILLCPSSPTVNKVYFGLFLTLVVLYSLFAHPMNPTSWIFTLCNITASIQCDTFCEAEVTHPYISGVYILSLILSRLDLQTTLNSSITLASILQR